MSPTDLKGEILTGPLAAELAQPWADGNDSTVAAVLNRADRTGYVPGRYILACLLQDASGFGPSLIWAWKHGVMPDGTNPPTASKVLLAQLFTAAELSSYAFKTPPADLSAGCDAMGAPAALKAALLAGEVKVSRAQELGWSVTPDDVGKARKVV